ncbi:MAG: hypothetical protein HY399_00400 [Elusimicrobia bacterium]|nr:hypothetical protein [Elusimicrobiota bacterium]
MKWADPRFERNAITFRFGNSNPYAPSKLEIQIGNVLHATLFLVALITYLL